MDEHRAGQNRFDRCLHELLEATEALHACVLGEADPVRLVEAQERRESAFKLLREASEDSDVRASSARACLARIKRLDEEMIALGVAVVGELRSQRQSLHRRRSAIHAHGARERGEPLLLTVKA